METLSLNSLQKGSSQQNSYILSITLLTMTDFITPLLSAQADDLFNSILAKEEKMNLFKGIKKK